MKRLIVNSDDYGRTPDISRGIREAHRLGVVTSTTCMMNIPTTAADVAVAVRETPTLQMGVHLVLTMGKPLVSHLASLSDENGNFYRPAPLLEHLSSLDMAEVRLEWHAQLEAFTQAAGRQPTHIDSHHHSSYFSPRLFRAMLELAGEYGCAIRFPFTGEIMPELQGTSADVAGLLKEFNPRRPDRFISGFYDEDATREHLLDILNGLDTGTSEVMCHPGHVDGAFAQESVYNYQRERELRILTDPAIKDALRAHGIELITFADL